MIVRLMRAGLLMDRIRRSEMGARGWVVDGVRQLSRADIFFSHYLV